MMLAILLTLAQAITVHQWATSTPMSVEAVYSTSPSTAISPYFKWGTSPGGSTVCNVITAGGYGGYYAGRAFGKVEFLCGTFTPGTTVYVRLCHNPGSEVCTAEQTIALPAASWIPTLPTLPTVALTPPAVTGSTLTVGADPFDAVTGVQAQLDAATCGDEVVIPKAATDVGGVFTIRDKSCPSGYVTVRSSATAGELAPAGTRIKPASSVNEATEAVTLATAYDSGLATIWGGTMGLAYDDNLGNRCQDIPGTLKAVYNSGNTWSRLTSCEPSATTITITNVNGATPMVVTATSHGLSNDDFISITGANIAVNDWFRVAVVDANSFQLLDRFAAPVAPLGGTFSGAATARKMTWQAVTPTAFSSSRPTGACTVGTWGHFTGTGAAADWWNNAYLCDGTSAWRKVDLSNYASVSTGSGGSLRIENSNGVYVYGLKVQAVPYPRLTTLTLGAGWIPEGTYQHWLVSVDGASSRVVLDRVVTDGNSRNGARASGIFMNCSNCAVINSAVIDHAYWQRHSGSHPGYGYRFGQNENATAGGIYISKGASVLLRNNVMEVYGLTIHVDDQYPNSFIAPRDITIDKNLMFRGTTRVLGASESDGYSYCQRQFVEFKSGSKTRVEANRIIGGWTVCTPGPAAIVYSPIMSHNYGTTVNFTAAVGTFADATRFEYGSGFTAGDAVQVYSTGSLYTVSSGNSTTVTLSGSPGNGGQLLFNTQQPGTSDATVRYNTIAGIAGGVHFMGIRQFGGQAPAAWNPKPSTRYLAEHNLFRKLDGSRAVTGGYTAPAFAIKADYGSSFVTIKHNTAIEMKVHASSDYGGQFLLADGGARSIKSGKIRLEANLSTLGADGAFVGQGFKRAETSVAGTDSLDGEYTSANWSVVDQAFIDAAGNPGGFPTSTWLTSQTFRADGSLPIGSTVSSGGASHPSDGLDSGVNIQRLRDAQGLIVTHAVQASGGGFILRWSAPEACAAEHSSNGASWTRQSAGGAGAQSMTVSTASAGHQWRIMCPSDFRAGTY